MRALVTASLVAAILVTAASAHAQPAGVIQHRVGPDDSLELLAAEFYGHRRHAALIRLANGIDEARDLRRGERLRIPVGRRVVTRPGQSLADLASEYLGDERRAEILASYNDLASDASLAAGVLIRVPFHVQYTANKPERLDVLAARYLAGSRDAEILRDYNFLDDDQTRVEEGESILVPALHVAVRAARLPRLSDGAQARVDTRQRLQAEADETLPSARHAWRHGDYEAVETQLAPLDIAFLDADAALEVSLLLGGALIARGDIDAAKGVFEAALLRDPDYEISAYHFSPAIRAVWEELGGRIDTSSR